MLSPSTTPRNAIWLPIFAGLCASLVSIGLARFAYTPLIPSLIQAHWFSASDVVYLGAANLVGYLIGALIGHPLARRTSNKTALRLMMLAVTLSFFACGFSVVGELVLRLASAVGRRRWRDHGAGGGDGVAACAGLAQRPGQWRDFSRHRAGHCRVGDDCPAAAEPWLAANLVRPRLAGADPDRR